MLLSKPVLVQRDPPSPDLTDCQVEPLPDLPFKSEADRYAWAWSAIYAGRDCRETLKAAKQWMLNPPKDAP